MAVAETVDIGPGENVRAVPVTAPFVATVWQIGAEAGEWVMEGEPLLSLEAMKLESKVATPVSGTLMDIYVKPGEQVVQGQVLAAVRP